VTRLALVSLLVVGCQLAPDSGVGPRVPPADAGAADHVDPSRAPGGPLGGGDGEVAAAPDTHPRCAAAACSAGALVLTASDCYPDGAVDVRCGPGGRAEGALAGLPCPADVYAVHTQPFSAPEAVGGVVLEVAGPRWWAAWRSSPEVRFCCDGASVRAVRCQ
jgi:hypothetical protein